MKHHKPSILRLLSFVLAVSLSVTAPVVFGAIPLRWNVDTSRVAPVTFEAYHGETLALEASFFDRSTPLEGSFTGTLYWQTNGMENAYWSTNTVTVLTNRATALFLGSFDPGAPAVRGFIALREDGTSVTGQNYRAAFTLRFRPSPGFEPGRLDRPPTILDFRDTVVINAPWPTDQTIDTRIRNVISNDHITAICPTNTITSIVSNTVTKAYVEDLGISGGGGSGCDTNAVQGIINKNVQTNYLCTVSALNNYYNKTTSDSRFIRANTNPTLGTTASEAYLKLGKANNNDSQLKLDQFGYVTRYKRDGTQDDQVNIFWIAATAVSNRNSQAALTASAATKLSQSQADTLYYPKASGEAWSSYWDGDEVRVTITNYYGSLALPHLYIEQRTNTTGSVSLYRTVWDEMTRWNALEPWKTNVTANISSLNANKADRAWGFYDSSTGSYAPDDFASISQPNILVAAGLAYQRTVTTTGDEYWVLTSTEPSAINGLTNGAFQVKDADGNVQVEIVKGDKRTVGARCNSVSVSGRVLSATYNVVSGSHPTIEVCSDLSDPTFIAEGEANCPATVVWSGSSGAYVATVTPVSASATSIFVKASYETGGDSMFYSHIPIKTSQLIIGNTTYNLGTTTISGSTVLTLTPAP